jgi:hypothetical protein
MLNHSPTAINNAGFAVWARLFISQRVFNNVFD